jgi:hypothetical protein
VPVCEKTWRKFAELVRKVSESSNATAVRVSFIRGFPRFKVTSFKECAKNPIAKRLDNKALPRRCDCKPIDLPARSSYRSRAQSVADVITLHNRASITSLSLLQQKFRR